MGGQNSTPFDMSSGLMQGAADGYQQLGNYNAPGVAQDYMNPYTDQVIGNTMADMDQMNQMQLGQIGDSAIASGAFGGSRHGIAEGVTNAETARAMGDISGNMRHAGYGNAMNDAFRNAGLIGQGAAGAANLGQQYFNTGNSLLNMQQRQGDIAQGTTQDYLNQGQGIFGGNDIMNLINQYQQGLGGSPLTGNMTGTNTHNPGTMETIGMGLGIGSSLFGGGK